ncbi:MAG TPA: 4-hydroxybenzoate octaprenyltransferase, partial [Magnetovibrio sp.]
FYTMTLVLAATSGWLAGLHWMFYVALLPAAGHLAWQVATLDIHDPKNCLVRFKTGRDFGLLLFAAIVAGQVV